MRHDGPVTSEPSTVPDGGPTPALIAACRGARPSHRPVWFMRQAGRSLPEYRAVRQGTAMLQACRTPDLVTEITLQPVRRYGVDGAVFYSDIVVPLHAAGIDVDIVAGVGPVLGSPVRDEAGVAALPELTPDQLGFVTQAVQMLVAELGEVPLIGFAGAPFTVASYLVEGGPSKTHERTKALMYGHPQLWDALLRRIGGYTTHGWGRCPRPTTGPSCNRIRPGCWRRSPRTRPTCRASTSGSAPVNCSPPSARPAPMSSASTSGCRSTSPRPVSAPATRFRETSTPHCFSRRGR
jgi:hypothetical protein